MTKVDHQSQAVHLANDLRPEFRYAAVSIESAARRVAYLIVSIMAQCDIHDATFGKVLHILQVIFYSQSVLNTNHNRLLSCPLVGFKLCPIASQSHIIGMCKHRLVYLVEYKVGISTRSIHIKRSYVYKVFALFRLWQISHHSYSIRTSIAHLMQVVAYARVAMVEINISRKEHRCVAMRVDGKVATVKTSCLFHYARLVNKPFKQRLTILA